MPAPAVRPVGSLPLASQPSKGAGPKPALSRRARVSSGAARVRRLPSLPGRAPASTCGGCRSGARSRLRRPAAGSRRPRPGAAVDSVVARPTRQVVPPDLDDVEHMCALLTSCDKLPIPPSLIPADFSACVRRCSPRMSSPAAMGFSLMMRECGLQSNSCAALRSCALRGANPDACAGSGKQGVVGFCDVDGRALGLLARASARGARLPPRRGAVHRRRRPGHLHPGAVPGRHQGGRQAPCSASGRHLLHCEKGKLASLDCAAFGLKCAIERRRGGRLRDRAARLRRPVEAVRRERRGRLLSTATRCASTAAPQG